LAIVFSKTHRSDSFFQKVQATSLQDLTLKTEKLRGFARVEATIEIADACLIKAGFPKFITQKEQIFEKNPCMMLIYTGRSYYDSLSSRFYAEDQKIDWWKNISDGFGSMLQVLWACRGNGHPEIRELIEMAQSPDFPFAKNVLKKFSNVIVDDRLFQNV